MVTSTMVKQKAEKEFKNVAEEIFSRIEKKLEEKMNDNTAINEFLVAGRVYVGYSFRIRELQRELGYEDDSTSWNALKEKAEVIVNEKFAEASWKRDGDYLIPLEEQKE